MAVELFGGLITLGRGQQPVIPASAPRPRDDLDEIGAPGTVYYSGFLDSEEYNKDLRGDKAIDVYTRMSKSDGMVKAILRSIVLPIRGAVPEIEPASEDPQDQLVANVVRRGLLEMEGQTWDDYIRQAVAGFLTFGHSVFEPVYSRPDSTANLVDVDGSEYLLPWKLAPRLAKSIYRWHIDRTGELRGIQQRTFVGTLDPELQVIAGDQGASTYAASGSYRYIDIPIERLIVFSLEREGANFAGESILRGGYKPWYYKSNLERIQALAAERHGIGVPYAIVRQGIAKAEENALIAALRNLHAHEKGYLLVSESSLGNGQTLGMPPIGILDMRAPQGRGIDIAINYHDRQMAISVLADFLTLGSGVGGNANVMHRDKSSLFFNSLRAVVDFFEDTMNARQGPIRTIVRLNFGESVTPPKLHLTSLEIKDPQRLAQALQMLLSSGAITTDAAIEQVLREILDLPLLPIDAQGNPVRPERPEPAAPPGDPEPDDDEEEEDTRPLAERLSARHLAEAPNTERAVQLQQRTARQMAELAARLADEEYEELDDAAFVEEGQSLLRSAMLAAFGLGAGAALRSDGESWARAAAEGQRGFLQGFAAALLGNGLTEAQRETRAAAYAAQVWTGFERGRFRAAEDGARIVWHAEGDDATCELCMARDEQEFTEATLPGFPGEGGFGEICEGAANCRCWLSYEPTGEA